MPSGSVGVEEAEALPPKAEKGSDMPPPGSVRNPGVQKSSEDVKESSEEETLDLRAGLESIFSNVMGMRKQL